MRSVLSCNKVVVWEHAAGTNFLSVVHSIFFFLFWQGIVLNSRISEMPQFDKLTFFNQVFWVIFIFFGFYIVLLKFFLPQLSSVLKIRQKKLKTSFSSAEASNFSFSSQLDVLGSLQRRLRWITRPSLEDLRSNKF